MKKELDNELCEKYPKIFKDRNESKMKTLMCWGFPKDGWFHIIDKLCQHIQFHTDNNIPESKRESLQPVAVQVKEKFGTLRFYITGGDEYTDGMITMAEAMSEITCEECGMPGTLRKSGWWRTRCDKCHDERINH
tara:strand:- start:32596 stop:33000 length:405 start_codon:yes stop_codon:yes gene_type:complete